MVTIFEHLLCTRYEDMPAIYSIYTDVIGDIGWDRNTKGLRFIRTQLGLYPMFNEDSLKHLKQSHPGARFTL